MLNNDIDEVLKEFDDKFVSKNKQGEYVVGKDENNLLVIWHREDVVNFLIPALTTLVNKALDEVKVEEIEDTSSGDGKFYYTDDDARGFNRAVDTQNQKIEEYRGRNENLR